MRKIMLLILLAAVSSSAAPTAVAQPQPNDLRALGQTLTLKYMDCVIKWVRDNLIVTASPSEMADGGHSKCMGEFQALQEAQTQYLLSITPPSAPTLGAINKAHAIASDVRDMTKAHVIRLIIEVRSGK